MRPAIVCEASNDASTPTSLGVYQGDGYAASPGVQAWITCNSTPRNAASRAAQATAAHALREPSVPTTMRPIGHSIRRGRVHIIAPGEALGKGPAPVCAPY